MKIFQIVGNLCYYDATPIHQTLADTAGKYPPDVLFVEAPDYVFEGWGYDDTKDGAERFIQPTPPEGWMYNPETGGFEPINPPEQSDEISDSEALAIIMREDEAV